MSSVSNRLPTISCLSCGMELTSNEFEPGKNGVAPTARDYESCLRRCDRCGIGYSNADNASAEQLVRIYRDPFWNVPSFVAKGHERVLAKALNERNRPNKQYKFASINSEDHVTWTVFRALQLWEELDTVRDIAQLQVGDNVSLSLLLWGSNPDAECIDDCRLRKRLINILNRLAEKPNSRSEPDVILDFGSAGVVFIEVKLRSGNDFKNPDYAGWSQYTSSDRCFAKRAEAISQCGAYELVRNWRILDEYAGDRQGVLINLADDHGDLERFQNVINNHDHRRFIKCTWRDLLHRIAHRPQWLCNYLADRQVCSPGGGATIRATEVT